jgi:hypothetical protein
MAISLQADSTLPQGYILVDGQRVVSITDSGLTGDSIANGFLYTSTLYYTATGTTTFVKATYPWLRAIKVKVQAGGGGGGFAQIGGRVGAGGGAGGYGEKFLLASTLSANEVIVVGAGGEGGNPTLSAVDSANGGLTSSFGSWVVCTGGGGGGSMTSAGDNKNARRPGGPGGISTGGDINIEGQTGNDSSRLIVTSPTVIPFPTSGAGGNSMLGLGGTSVRDSLEFSIAIAGRNGTGYGSGGSGGCGHGASANAKGGDGANGIIIIDLYA